MGGIFPDRSRTGDELGDNTLLSMANKTCLEERGLLGCFILLRRLERDVSEREEVRRKSFNLGLGALFEKFAVCKGERGGLNLVIGRVAEEESAGVLPPRPFGESGGVSGGGEEDGVVFCLEYRFGSSSKGRYLGVKSP